MPEDAARIALFGTSEEPALPRRVEVGALSALVDNEAVRSISWNGVEVVRAISWPVRDESWITLPQQVHSDRIEELGSITRGEMTFTVADGALECRLELSFSSAGTIEADLTMTATRDFDTNRAGFTLLHPIEGVAGERLDIRHSDGTKEVATFPERISPSQPAFDIAGLRHEVAGVAVTIAFEGEIFEMEDQRNWTDASFKTYCRPLVFPFTYRIAAGEAVRQSIRISLQGDGVLAPEASDGRVAFTPKGTLPHMALAIEPGWLADPAGLGHLAKSGVGALQVRVDASVDDAFMGGVRSLIDRLGAELDVEIIVPEGMEPETCFEGIRDQLRSAGLEPDRILSVPEPYLKSHQPSGPWPEGPAPDDCAKAARSIFPAARIGGGMLTNFTEFNRCAPDPLLCDFISHGTTAIVHAADDRSVRETIEALPAVFSSAIHLGNGRPYRLGLTSIGMRSNPYGADVADNPDQVRQTMARYDPRHCGLFAAAFAVAVLRATENQSVEVVSLAAPAGPFGLLAEARAVPRGYFDHDPDAVVYPIFHVVRQAARMGQARRLGVTGLPKGLHAVATANGTGWDMMIANLSDRTLSATLPAAADVRLLDTRSFVDAARDPDWLVNAEPQRTAQIDIQPMTVAFASRAGSAA